MAITTPNLEDDPRRHGSAVRRRPHVRPPSRRQSDAGGTSAPRTLLDIFSATVARCGERTAIDAPDGAVSYRRLAAAAERLAARLKALGVGPGDRVGLRVGSGSADLYVGLLGILTAGAAYVPVDADDPPARAADLFERAGACAVVDDGLVLTPLGEPGGSDRPLRPGDDAWVIFTSGSTGAPKGVAVSHRAAAAFVDAEARLWRIDLDDRVLAGLSVSFDASCEEMWLAWRHGAALVPAPRSLVRSGVDLGPWIADCAVTVVSTVPTLASMWDRESLRGVRLLILGGEACPEKLGWELAADREVWNTYGPTEATVVSTATRIRPGRPITIGQPLRGWRVAVLDDDGSPAAFGEQGELVIAGAGLGRYLDPELDQERFAPVPSLGWRRAYRSGDIVRETPDGIEFIGRRDHQVKVAGRRLELGEIDAAVSGAPGVKAAATVVRESEAGNKLLVCYVVGDVDADAVRGSVEERLAAGVAPLIVPLASMPRGSSGKIDRNALPWPPPRQTASRSLSGMAAWVAELWKQQLGPVQIGLDSDFFALGGSSLAAAKLVSELRVRYPAVAVADVYNHRRLADLCERLERISEIDRSSRPSAGSRTRWWQLTQLAGVLALIVLTAPQWLIGILAVDHWHAGQIGPQVGWLWLIGAWIVFASAPGRALIVLAARRLLLNGMTPGRYPRRGWLSCRIWFVERLADLSHLERLAGTPWAARYARLSGHRVDPTARLATLPPPTALVEIGAGATIEADVDMHGWWIEGDELVVGRIEIGADARVATRALLMPGAEVGARAEIETGAVISERVPAGERWAGAPGAKVGIGGEGWPTADPPTPRHRRGWRAMYGIGLALHSVLALAAAVPGIALLMWLAPHQWSAQNVVTRMLILAPVLAGSFIVAYGLLVAGAVRAVRPLIRPGWHGDQGATAWALWFTGELVGSTHDVLFPIYASVYTRSWLRLLGIKVGRRAEISTAVNLSHITAFAERSFAADDVVLATSRARGGWLHVSPIEIGSETFLGNGAIIEGGTTVPERSLVGLLTVAPKESVPGSSWLGAPALELPRRPTCADPARTTDPPRRLVIARATADLIRILLPSSAAVVLASLVFWSLDAVGAGSGVWAMAASAPVVVTAAGLLAVGITAVVKWTLIGRYRPGDHPLWSWFVWRDEILNTCQEQLAGGWLLGFALGTPLMSLYLRLMGATIGRDVWCETLTITEFDVATLGEGSTVNRNAVVETHLFHDRVMQIGPATLGANSTLGPSTAMLPDTELGEGCSVGGRSIIMRGERLPANTRWHGAPVVAV